MKMTKKIIQHIGFSVDFRNVDAADPRCNTITNLMFSGVPFEAGHDDEKEAAIHHVFSNVLPHADVVAQFGKIIPLFKTFKLISVHTPSDQGWA
jgi:hypothetical protein